MPWYAMVHAHALAISLAQQDCIDHSCITSDVFWLAIAVAILLASILLYKAALKRPQLPMPHEPILQIEA